MGTLKASRAQRDGNALREYKQTITLNAIQKEAGFARALPLVCQRSVRRRLYTFRQKKKRRSGAAC